MDDTALFIDYINRDEVALIRADLEKGTDSKYLPLIAKFHSFKVPNQNTNVLLLTIYYCMRYDRFDMIQVLIKFDKKSAKCLSSYLVLRCQPFSTHMLRYLAHNLFIDVQELDDDGLNLAEAILIIARDESPFFFYDEESKASHLAKVFMLTHEFGLLPFHGTEDRHIFMQEFFCNM